MKMKTLIATAALVLSPAWMTTIAHASDIVTITIENPNQSVSPGGTLSYFANISAASTNTDSVFLNGDVLTFSGPSTFTLDDGPFFSNFPFSLNAGDSVTAELFDITVPADASLGNFSGTFVLQGGLDGGTFDTLDTANYSTGVTPEPSSLLLLTTGLFGAAWLWKRHEVGQRG